MIIAGQPHLAKHESFNDHSCNFMKRIFPLLAQRRLSDHPEAPCRSIDASKASKAIIQTDLQSVFQPKAVQILTLLQLVFSDFF